MANPRAFTVAHWRFLGGFCGFVFRCIYSTFQGDLAEVRVCVRKLSASGVGKFAAGGGLEKLHWGKLAWTDQIILTVN